MKHICYTLAISRSYIPSSFNFNYDVHIQGQLSQTSDEKMKEQIAPLNNSLSLLQQLNGVSYYLKPSTDYLENLKKNLAVDTKDLSEKERKELLSAADIDKAIAEQKANRKLQMGFVAQELQKIFPNLVYSDEDGLLSVNYIGLIPVLVESIKEQQQQIEELKALLTGKNTLRSDNSAEETAAIATINSEAAVLYQNTPNPFTEQTEIRYSIPANTKQAFICIFDMQGAMLKKIDVTKNSNQITIQGSEFAAGMYLYSLVVDGKEVDTKRMILTK
ncbi:hypothetical protein FACS189413_14670 [Bacteroidia bacterium]|nr:hypothetical protein FACS189463_0240 [Bacteroidia bacterium]GHU72095.1 hypothetical protein FACS189413_14670 [Bacteroidia bacterium]